MKIFSRRPTVKRSTLITSQLSFPPSLYPAQMKMCGMCSLKPAFSYMASHCELLMMGRSTSCSTAGSGPSAMESCRHQCSDIHITLFPLAIEEESLFCHIWLFNYIVKRLKVKIWA